MLGLRNRQSLTLEGYRDRNETLRLIGFKSYSAYGRSKLWRIIRERALQIHGNACAKCGRVATQVHHASYGREVLTGEDVRGLVPLCAGCHGGASRASKKAEQRDRLEVRALGATNERLSRRFSRRSTALRQLRLEGKLAKSQRKALENPKPEFCACGQMRKKNNTQCKKCIKKTRVRISAEEIRARSLEYAFR